MRIMPISNNGNQCHPSCKSMPATRLTKYKSLLQNGAEKVGVIKEEGKIANLFFVNKNKTGIFVTDSNLEKIGSLTAKLGSRNRYWCKSMFGKEMSNEAKVEAYKLLSEQAHVKYLYANAHSQKEVDMLRQLGFQGGNYNPKALINQLCKNVGNRMGYFKV